MAGEQENVALASSALNHVHVPSSDTPQSLEKTKTSAYGAVVLALDSVVLPDAQLASTPSIQDGLTGDQEADLRILGCELIHVSGILLRLPQVAMATAQVLFQRFYYSESFVRQSMEAVAMACITLASKIEEAPRRIRDVINVFHHMKQTRNSLPIQALMLDKNYVELKNQVIKAERRLLKDLGFCVHIKHPHKFIVTLLQVLECENNQRLIQSAWNYMNDCLRSDVFVRYTPESIACSCIYLSARILRIPLPSSPSWFEIFNVSEDTIRKICHTILALYTRPKVNQLKLEEIVNKLKRDYETAKLLARALASNATTQSSQSTEATESKSNSPDKDEAKKEVPANASEEKVVPVEEPRSSSPRNGETRNRRRSRSGSVSVLKNYNQDRSPKSKNRHSPTRSYARNESRSRSRSKDRSRSRRDHHSNRRERDVRQRRRSRSVTPPNHYNNHKSDRYYGSSKKSRRPVSRERSSYSSKRRGSRSPHR